MHRRPFAVMHLPANFGCAVSLCVIRRQSFGCNQVDGLAGHRAGSPVDQADRNKPRLGTTQCVAPPGCGSVLELRYCAETTSVVSIHTPNATAARVRYVICPVLFCTELVPSAIQSKLSEAGFERLQRRTHPYQNIQFELTDSLRPTGRS
jgi:hypothetical protein